MDVLYEAFVEFLLIYPGAFIRWIIFRRRSFKSYLRDSVSHNVMTAVIFFISITLIILLVDMLLN